MDTATLLQIAQLAAVLVILPVYRGLRKLRTNELKHVTHDLAEIRAELRLLRRDFVRHLELHGR